MKPFDIETHYDVLEIGRDASPEEVERAYRLAAATYAEDSLATYSLLSEEEAGAARERVELAYEVLSDPVARQHYDASLGEDEDPEETPLPGEHRALPPPPLLPPEEEPRPPMEVMPRIHGFEDVDEQAEDGVYDGPRLRRARLLRGIDIDQIASVTKVNPTYLSFIEEERFDDLPATVYVRGFLSAYARCLGLDAGRVVPTYMERLQGHRDEGQGRSR